MNHSNPHIEKCVRLIESKWQRGPREEWSSYDFEKLNAAIFESTGVSLSVSTLKRIFGKVSYSNIPSTHTLNTLARFAGFADWNDFRRHHPAATPPIPGRIARWWPILLLPLAIVLYSLLNNRNPEPPAPRHGDYSFTCNKIMSEGYRTEIINSETPYCTYSGSPPATWKSLFGKCP